MTLEPYGLVRMRRLLRAARAYDEWGVNRRAPAIGDLGVIVEIVHAPDQPDGYVVESVERDGNGAWLSTFSADELERVEDQSTS